MTDQEKEWMDQMIQPLIWKPVQAAQLQNVEGLGDIDNIPKTYSRLLAVQAASKEDQLLIEVLQEHLGRLVCVEDFKHCQMKFLYGQPNKYVFGYCGIDLGIVTRELKMDYKPDDFTRNLFSIYHTITFSPVKAK